MLSYLDKYKLILCDIDGTLRTADGFIDSRLLPLMCQLEQLGYRVVLVTGRTYRFYREFVNELLQQYGGAETMLPFQCIIYESGQRMFTLSEHITLADPIVREELEYFKTFFNHSLRMTSGRIEYADFKLQGVCSVTLIDNARKNNTTPTQPSSAYVYIRELLEQLQLHNLAVYATSPVHMMIGARAVNKKTAIEILGLDCQTITFCCDGENDRELAEYIAQMGGSVICPSNAVDTVRRCATFITTRSGSAGICDYLSSIATATRASV